MKLKRSGLLYAALGVLLLSTPSAHAQSGNTGTSSEGRLSMMDRRFVTASALGNMMEIDHGRLASRQASSEAVRRFAEQMVTEHTRAQRDLLRVARDAGMNMPAGIDVPPTSAATSPLPAETLSRLEELGLRHLAVEHQETSRLLSGLTGPMFDEAYLGAQIKAHAKTLADYEFHAQKARDSGVRGYASRYTTPVQHHLMMARQIAGVTSRMAGMLPERVAGERMIITPTSPLGERSARMPRVDGVLATDILFRLTPAEQRSLSTLRPRRAGEIAYISYVTGQPVSTIQHWLESTYAGDMHRMALGLNLDRRTIARAGETLGHYLPRPER